MLFFSSSIGKGFGGDFIYSKQIRKALEKECLIDAVEIKNTKIFYCLFIFLLFPFFYFFPLMWRPIYVYKNISAVLVKKAALNHGETVFIDHFRNAWVLLFLLPIKKKKNLEFVLVTHNIEQQIAKECYETKTISTKLFHYIEYVKIKFWELFLFRRVDSITTITEEDATLIESFSKKIVVIKPYYDKHCLNHSTCLSEHPNCLIIGSFGWAIKQDNLLDLLDSFSQLNIPESFKIVIAGSMPEHFSDILIGKYKFIDLKKNYESIDELVCTAKLAIAPDQIGGGFKLKILDYFYLGLPVFGLSGSMNGIKNCDKGIMTYENYNALVRGVISHINDVTRLSEMSKVNRNLLELHFNEEIMNQKVRELLSGN